MNNRITVFVIPPFSCSIASGGAENICRMLCLSLAKQYKVTVIHSSDSKELLGRVKQHSENLFSCNAFYMDSWIQERGVISPVFCKVAQKVIQESELLISFERTLLGIAIPQITILGGISYIHCKDIATSNIWDKLIVPSNFIKKQCGKLRNGTSGIQVIYNGINCSCYFKSHDKKTYTALLPFRPDRGKGFFESIEFVSLVNMIGKWGQYSILITRSDNIAYSSFYDEIDRYANISNVTIKYIPWCKSDAMNDVYNKADFVLAIGYLEEGFGLTTIESVLAGRAVITRKIGATSEVLPSNGGAVFLESSITCESVTSIMDLVTSEKMNMDLSTGANYIRENYKEDRMCEELNMVVKEYLD